MDWAKILDKFSVFIAALIPGSFVLLVAALHHSELWRKLWDLNYLGYQTKIGILVFAAFAAGLTVNEGVAFILNFAGNFVTSYKMAVAQKEAALQARQAAQGAASGPSLQERVPPQAPVVQLEVPLWRSQNWRSLLAVYLGTAAPENVVLIDESQLSNDALWQEWWTLLSWQVMPKDDPQSKR